MRSSIIDVVSYDLLLDLTVGAQTFWSRTELSFCCRREGAHAFADLRPVEVRRVVLNGADLTGHHLHREGRLELTDLARENTLVVEAEFAYAETGRACTDSAVGRTSPAACTAMQTSAAPPGSSAVSTSPTCVPRSRSPSAPRWAGAVGRTTRW
jgi:hypothetical protein